MTYLLFFLLIAAALFGTVYLLEKGIKTHQDAQAEIDYWKAKYIEARRSGYEEGLEEARRDNAVT